MTIPSQLQQTFSSNFSGFANGGGGGAMWQTTLPHGLRTIAGTGEEEYYSDPSVGVDPFSVNDGSLDITATAGSTQPGLGYTSGVISTESSFSQLYGYFQITATLPSGDGYWPAFWLLPSNLSGTQEIDVMEEYGTNPSQYAVSVHSPAAGLASTTVATPDLTAGSNTYGVYWTPQSISYYFNNQLVAVTPTPADMNTPMFMIANLAVSDAVSSGTTFPGTMQISSIDAYAYNPNVPGPTAQLLTNTPTTLDATIGRSTAVAGVSITDPAASASDVLSVTVSDQSLGILSVTAEDGATVSINDGWEVQLTGSLNAVNATLQTLEYKNVATGATTPTTDTLTVSASDPNGNMDSSRTSVVLNQSLPTPQFIAFGSAPERVMASGNDVFQLTAGQIADPATNDGQADHIVDFLTAAQSAGGTSDFLALYGFASTATLVFSHYADVNGVPDTAMQYYQVDSPSGNSPIFLVQMDNQSGAHLARADYGFYPS
ncbi:MAG TPA: glycoside hydrolase family 16 protein [Rhodopila sp.]|nr:glycoside hydrolase family 16 protein [Rhodopila sp.]